MFSSNGFSSGVTVHLSKSCLCAVPVLKFSQFLYVCLISAFLGGSENCSYPSLTSVQIFFFVPDMAISSMTLATMFNFKLSFEPSPLLSPAEQLSLQNLFGLHPERVGAAVFLRWSTMCVYIAFGSTFFIF